MISERRKIGDWVYPIRVKEYTITYFDGTSTSPPNVYTPVNAGNSFLWAREEQLTFPSDYFFEDETINLPGGLNMRTTRFTF